MKWLLGFVVRAAGDWPWGSYRAMRGRGGAPEWLDRDWLLGQFGRQRSRAVQKTEAAESVSRSGRKVKAARRKGRSRM